MSKRIIAISRQFGSGGHSLGKLLAEKLGISFYDEEIIEKVVAETGFSREFVREAGEYASTTNSLLYNIALSGMLRPADSSTIYDKVYFAQTKIIEDLAEKEPCVIVGRCADYILRERKDCLRVFVFADTETRIKRVRERYGDMKAKSIEERLAEKD